ncbi:MAG: amidohydrolase [Spirochaetales bacterium]|nr:amidohydrolase [Spirochaetales bacterium]
MGQLLLYNGNIITLDPACPKSEAVLIGEDLILSVGSDREMADSACAGARCINLEGRTVIPGFNDNHLHAVSMGVRQILPQLHGLDESGIVEALRLGYPDAKPGALLTGIGWDYTTCPEPKKEVLDKAFPDNPVLLIQFSGHGIWVSSNILRKMKIGRPKSALRVGTVIRDAAGEATGVLRGAIQHPYIKRIFWVAQYRRRENAKYLRFALDQFARAGITSVQDNTWFFPTVRNLARAYARDELSCRFSCWSYGSSRFSRALMGMMPYRDQWYSRGPVKLFVDGAFSSRSAWLTKDYSNDPGNSGQGLNGAEIASLLEPLVKRRKTAVCHAIGDRAVKEYLDGIELLIRKYPYIPDLRLRIEHVQLIRPGDIPRIKAHGILIASQPAAVADPEKDLELIGEKRLKTAYPYRALLDAGVDLSFGSDAPAELFFDPLQSIHAAVNREPEVAVSAREALRCYTEWSAFAEFREDQKGTVTPGKAADLAILSDDILAVDPVKIRDIKVEMTISAGRVVYNAI